MKRILCALLVATLPFGSVLADAPKEKNAKVTLVYQHELPNVPGKSIKARSSNTAGRLLARPHACQIPPSSTRLCSKGRCAVRSTTEYLSPVRTEFAGNFTVWPGSHHVPRRAQ